MTTAQKWIGVLLSLVLIGVSAFNTILLLDQKDQLQTAQGQISSLQSQLSQAGTDINTLKSQLTAVNGHLATLDGQIGELLKLSTAQVDAIASVMASVVYIEVDYYDRSTGERGTVSGSGTIMDSRGYILTNRHVVENATNVTVILPNKQVYTAEDFWIDDFMDVAVVKIKANGLQAASFGDPSTLKMGDTVVALGYPLSISPTDGGMTVTAGIVSNLENWFFIDETPYFDVIQTDAAINPGNSGGPMINLTGEIIGINSAGILDAQNMGFAINVATAEQIYESLVADGSVSHPYLGIDVDDYYDDIPGFSGATESNGVEVLDVEHGSPADLAGLRDGDVIYQFDGKAVTSFSDLLRILWRMESGETVVLQIKRGGVERTITIFLEDRPSSSYFF
ncbi:trypsin-like peptidase domain-containing protein [Dehalococcoides mccartyi]|jgi:serine protease Do|uniref:Serine protease, DegP/HtrA family n=2 Tax=Dehalococcoides mccartyi TaxID=61435 RepID=A0A142VAW5_9CHLR|nr:trypsin-like peptidase domain-containing protein [Dehalococcoides mccartyi]AII61243.1 serine protease [Dehalococcoides mccartyi CG5]AMU86938.1 serine protease, DegP/HtrA family [Dehalococcoides mccartyi]AOV99728.1 serine protease precursor MucD/AlgY associated with sigma factor RpoE [Dehalococcoides mccartyi]MBA2085507.1 Serine protease precursor MucD/AlgY associated with sigma factor RpoE [Dehalococcoides mccartyi]PKH46224.1 serine protease [Dehalococcoides mccartyi]